MSLERLQKINKRGEVGDLFWLNGCLVFSHPPIPFRCPLLVIEDTNEWPQRPLRDQWHNVGKNHCHCDFFETITSGDHKDFVFFLWKCVKHTNTYIISRGNTLETNMHDYDSCFQTDLLFIFNKILLPLRGFFLVFP